MKRTLGEVSFQPDGTILIWSTRRYNSGDTQAKVYENVTVASQTRLSNLLSFRLRNGIYVIRHCPIAPLKDELAATRKTFALLSGIRDNEIAYNLMLDLVKEAVEIEDRIIELERE